MPANNTSSITSARINKARAGTRIATLPWLEFRADHARARDAVYSELNCQFLSALENKFGTVTVQTPCASRTDFILFPPKGKILSDEALQHVSDNCIAAPDVQIVISDGLSARAVEANVFDLLPVLFDGFALAGLSVGTPVLVRYGRVSAADPIANKLKARLVINLVGERPGLSTAESLSAYITLNPGNHTISSDRTVVSNIHRGGTPVMEAAAYIVSLVKKIFQHGASGVQLQKIDK